MKQLMILTALALMGVIALSGCGEEAEATVNCDGGCGMEMARSDAMLVDGKAYCAACAVKVAKKAGEELKTAMVECAGGCGMEMAKLDAQQIDGKYYCAGCASHAGHDHGTTNKPPPGTEAH